MESVEIVKNGIVVSFFGPPGDPSMVSFLHLLEIDADRTHHCRFDLVTTGTLKHL
jgi:hypothetical protein